MNLKLKNKKLGIYIHIPFCKQKCFYCDFTSFASKEEFQEKYILALIKEIKFFLKNNPQTEISTIYIGGGTPSYIDSKYIKQILELLNTKNIETTIEVNPGTADFSKLKDYKDAGVNRLSIGLQSTENALLKLIGRIHNFEDFLNTYNMAKKAGFNNINADLMIGLPTQKIEDIKKSLNKLIELDLKHISIYSLIVEENTILSKKIDENELELPDEDLERNMYWYVKNFLELNGYKHYEISNFAKPDFESKHNLACWEQEEYIGFGVASHSYIDGVRFSNTENLDEYILNCENGEFEKNKTIHEVQNKFDMEKEFMLLGLRKIDGVSIQKFKNKFDENPVYVFRNELNKLVEENLITIDLDNIKLTNKGIDLANLVWQEFC